MKFNTFAKAINAIDAAIAIQNKYVAMIIIQSTKLHLVTSWMNQITTAILIKTKTALKAKMVNMINLLLIDESIITQRFI